MCTAIHVVQTHKLHCNSKYITKPAPGIGTSMQQPKHHPLSSERSLPVTVFPLHISTHAKVACHKYLKLQPVCIVAWHCWRRPCHWINKRFLSRASQLLAMTLTPEVCNVGPADVTTLIGICSLGELQKCSDRDVHLTTLSLVTTEWISENFAAKLNPLTDSEVRSGGAVGMALSYRSCFQIPIW